MNQDDVAKANSLPQANILTQVRWLRLLQVALDATVCFVAITGAFLIRFDGSIGGPYAEQVLYLAPLFICLHLFANWFYGVYRRLWRYTGLTEIVELAVSALSVTTFIIALRALNLLSIAGNQLSYGIIFIEFGLIFLLMASPRVLRRLQIEHGQRRHWRQPIRRRALLVGAGDAGMMVAREMTLRPDLGTDIVGLVDDDPQKANKRIGNLTIFGTTYDLPRLVENLFIDQVIIAMPSAPASQIRRIVEVCREAEVETRILPGLFELIDGRVSVNQLRDVSLEDLLGREPVDLDTDSIAGYIENRRVLITGAGGSIGSELCRQIMKFQPREIILVGRGENSIFSILEELKRRPEPVNLVPVIADIRDQQRMLNVFTKHVPQVVFHAAAHKHVPLMEHNTSEAITNNIRGTQVIAELSDRFAVNTFVLVSSDKAVNPTSVMGASKRAAEIVIQNLAARSKTKFVAVRFGNVLDSRGSVLPTWRKQIASGGPLTITDPEMTRYFMLIPEAVQLIIQAGALGSGGEIFVLDMGKPVKILDLAQDLIRLSGLRPGQDIEIQYVGLRPGEKLYEELLTAEEGLQQTTYKKIFVGKAQAMSTADLNDALKLLFLAAISDDESTIRKELQTLVGGTISQGIAN